MTRDKFNSKVAFYLSLFFWIPLFNIAICITSFILAMKMLNKHIKSPNKFGGLGYIITALILSITGIVLTIIGLVFYLLSEDVCTRAICQNFYA